MAFNPFIGWSQEELEAALSDAQDDYAAGKTLTSIGAGDSSSSKLVQSSPMARIEAICKALYALDPVTNADYKANKVTRTQVQFSGYTDGNYLSS